MTEVELGLPDLPRGWEIQVQLRCASICGFSLPARIVTGLLACRDAPLLELYLHLRGWETDTALAEVVRTNYERTVTGKAYARFYAALKACRRTGRAPSRTLAWIVPGDSASLQNFRNRWPERLSTEAQDCIRADLNGAPDIAEWLPWLSLSIVACLRRWRTARISALRRALFKLAEDFDSRANAHFPWERSLNRNVRALPIQTLYQYEASDLVRNSLEKLDRLGFGAINDLRFLHPDAVAAAKRRDEPLLRLYRLCRR